MISTSPPSKRTVLCDDDEAILRYEKTLLERSGYAVLTAASPHLLAAVHFRLGHLAVWQTGKHRRDRPQNQQTHDQNGADLCHCLMLHPHFLVCKVASFM